MLRLRFCSSALSTLQQILFFPLRHLGRNSLIFHTKDACRRQMLSLPLAWVSGEFYIAHLVYFCLCLCMWCVCTCVFMFAYGQVLGYMHVCVHGYGSSTPMLMLRGFFNLFTSYTFRQPLLNPELAPFSSSSCLPRSWHCFLCMVSAELTDGPSHLPSP